MGIDRFGLGLDEIAFAAFGGWDNEHSSGRSDLFLCVPFSE